MVSKFLCVCVLLLLSAGSPALASNNSPPAKRTLVIAADIWCPVNCDPAGSEQGLAIEMAREIFEPQGYSLTYKILPWTRAILEAKRGRVDIIPGGAKEETEGLLLGQQKIFDSETSIYALALSSFKYAGLASLQKKHIGTIQGYTYDDRLLDLFAKNEGYIEAVSSENGFEINFKKLKAGRLDAMVETSAVMDYNLRLRGAQNEVVLLDSIGPPEEIFMAFSPLNPQARELASLYDRGVAELRHSGKLAKLYAKYHITMPSLHQKKSHR